MIVKTKLLIMLTRMAILLVRVLWQSNENFYIFFKPKIIKIELKMTCQSSFGL